MRPFAFAEGPNGHLEMTDMPYPVSHDLLSVISEDFGFERGHPPPFGATVARGGINFAIFSRHATAVTLLLFQPGSKVEMAAFLSLE